MALSDRDRKPFYRQVAEEIKASIAAGEWSANCQLPSEPELARRFAVSRATVREALRVLEQEGVVRARRGHGTFVVDSSRILQVGVDSLYSITDAIRLQGHTPGTAELVIRLEPPAAATTKLFTEAEPGTGSEAGAREAGLLAVIERTRLADGNPVVYSRDMVPLRYLKVPDWQERVSMGSLFNLLLEEGFDLAFTETRIQAVGAPEEAAERLEVRPGGPVLLMEETVYDREARPVLVSQDYYRTDRIEVNLVRRRNG